MICNVIEWQLLYTLFILLSLFIKIQYNLSTNTLHVDLSSKSTFANLKHVFIIIIFYIIIDLLNFLVCNAGWEL